MPSLLRRLQTSARRRCQFNLHARCLAPCLQRGRANLAVVGAAPMLLSRFYRCQQLPFPQDLRGRSQLLLQQQQYLHVQQAHREELPRAVSMAQGASMQIQLHLSAHGNRIMDRHAQRAHSDLGNRFRISEFLCLIIARLGHGTMRMMLCINSICAHA